MKTEIIFRENRAVNESYYLVKHKSGLDIIVSPKKLSSSYAMLATKYGSIDNAFRTASDGEYTRVPDGVAHFLEHKLFDNEKGEDTFSRYAKTGANANAYTSFDVTAYLFSCADNFYDSLEILLDFVTHPYFTEESVKKEQGIIGQEIKMYEDNPGTRLLFDAINSMYFSHNVRLDICGSVSSISKITPEILYRCCEVFYNLSNMALSICGDVDLDRIIEVCDRLLPSETEKVVIEREKVDEPDRIVRPYFERRMQVSKPLFAIGMKDVAPSDDERERSRRDLAMKILNLMLFGKSSELYTELYSSSLIGNDWGYEYDGCRGCVFNLISGESSSPKEVYRIFGEYIARKLETGLDKDDFERCKRVLYAAIIRTFDSSENVASELLYNHIEGSDFLDMPDVINETDFEYTEALFRKFYGKENRILSVVLPLEEK